MIDGETGAYEPSRDGLEGVRHYPEIWHSIRYWVREYDVQFEVFRMIDDAAPHAWSERDASSGPTYCTDMDHAERCLTGYVKWDGCSNWDMIPDEGAMRHYCDKEHVTNFGAAMASCYDIAEELLPGWFG